MEKVFFFIADINEYIIISSIIIENNRKHTSPSQQIDE